MSRRIVIHCSGSGSWNRAPDAASTLISRPRAKKATFRDSRHEEVGAGGGRGEANGQVGDAENGPGNIFGSFSKAGKNSQLA